MKSFPAIDRAREAARKRLGVATLGWPSSSSASVVDTKRPFREEKDDVIHVDGESVRISVNKSMPNMSSSLKALASKMDALFIESTAFIEETNGASRALLARAVKALAILSKKEEHQQGKGHEEAGQEGRETGENPALSTGLLKPRGQDGVGEEVTVEREVPELVMEEEKECQEGEKLVPERNVTNVIEVKDEDLIDEKDVESDGDEAFDQEDDRQPMDEIGRPPLATGNDVVDPTLNSSPMSYRNLYDALPNVLEERGKHAFAKEWNCLKLKHRSFLHWSASTVRKNSEAEGETRPTTS